MGIMENKMEATMSWGPFLGSLEKACKHFSFSLMWIQGEVAPFS